MPRTHTPERMRQPNFGATRRGDTSDLAIAIDCEDLTDTTQPPRGATMWLDGTNQKVKTCIKLAGKHIITISQREGTEADFQAALKDYFPNDWNNFRVATVGAGDKLRDGKKYARVNAYEVIRRGGGGGPVINLVDRSFKITKAPAWEILSGMIAHEFPVAKALKEIIDNALESHRRLELRMRGGQSASFKPQIDISVAYDERKGLTLRVVDNGGGCDAQEVENWASLGSSDSKETGKKLEGAQRFGLFAMLIGAFGVGSKGAGASLSDSRGTVALRSLQASQVGGVAAQMVSIEMNLAEAQRLSQQRSASVWDREVHVTDAKKSQPALHAFTELPGWGERVTCLEVTQLSSKTRAALAPGAIKTLSRELAKTYKYFLCKQPYEELIKAADTSFGTQNPKPLEIDMHVKVTYENAPTYKNGDLREYKEDLNKLCAQHFAPKETAAAGERRTRVTGAGELSRFVVEKKFGDGVAHVQLSYHPARDGNETVPREPGARQGETVPRAIGVDTYYEGRQLPDETLRLLPFMDPVTLGGKAGQRRDLRLRVARILRSCDQAVLRRITGDLLVNGAFAVNKNKSAMNPTGETAGADLVKQLQKLSIDDCLGELERFEVWLNVCRQHDEEARFVYEEAVCQMSDYGAGYMTHQVCIGDKTFTAPLDTVANDAPLSVWLLDKLDRPKDKAHKPDNLILARVEGFRFTTEMPGDEDDLPVEELKALCAGASDDGKICFVPWTHEAGARKMLPIAHLVAAKFDVVDKRNGSTIEPSAWDREVDAYRKKHEKQSLEKLPAKVELLQFPATTTQKSTLDIKALKDGIALEDIVANKFNDQAYISVRVLNHQGKPLDKADLVGEPGAPGFCIVLKVGPARGAMTEVASCSGDELLSYDAPGGASGRKQAEAGRKQAEAWFRVDSRQKALHQALSKPGDYKIAVSVERGRAAQGAAGSSSDGAREEGAKPWELKVKVNPPSRPDKLKVAINEDIDVHLHVPLPLLTLSATDAIGHFFALSDPGGRTLSPAAAPKVTVWKQPKDVDLKVGKAKWAFAGGRVRCDDLKLSGPLGGKGKARIELKFAFSTGGVDLDPVTLGLEVRSGPATKLDHLNATDFPTEPLRAGDTLGVIKLAASDANGNPCLNVKVRAECCTGLDFDTRPFDGAKTSGEVNIRQNTFVVQGDAMDDQEKQAQLTLVALDPRVRKDNGSEVEDPTGARCVKTFTIAAKEPEDVDVKGIVISAENERHQPLEHNRVKSGESFWVIVDGDDGDGDLIELDLDEFGDRTRLELGSDVSKPQDINFEFPWVAVNGRLKVKVVVSGETGVIRLKLPGDHDLDCDKIEQTHLNLNLTAGDPEKIQVKETDLATIGIENGGKLEVNAHLEDADGNTVACKRWKLTAVDETNKLIEQNPGFPGKAAKGKLGYYLATTEPVLKPTKVQFNVAATIDNVTIDKTIEVLIRPSKALVGELTLSRLSVDHELGGGRLQPLEEDLVLPAQPGAYFPPLALAVRFENGTRLSLAELGECTLLATLKDESSGDLVMAPVAQADRRTSRGGQAAGSYLANQVRIRRSAPRQLAQQVQNESSATHTALVLDGQDVIVPTKPGKYELTLELKASLAQRQATSEHMPEQLLTEAARAVPTKAIVFEVQPGEPANLPLAKQTLCFTGDMPVQVGELARLVDLCDNLISSNAEVLLEVVPDGAVPASPWLTLDMPRGRDGRVTVRLKDGVLTVPTLKFVDNGVRTDAYQLRLVLADSEVKSVLNISFANPRDQEKRKRELAEQKTARAAAEARLPTEKEEAKESRKRARDAEKEEERQREEVARITGEVDSKQRAIDDLKEELTEEVRKRVRIDHGLGEEPPASPRSGDDAQQGFASGVKQQLDQLLEPNDDECLEVEGQRLRVPDDFPHTLPDDGGGYRVELEAHKAPEGGYRIHQVSYRGAGAFHNVPYGDDKRYEVDAADVLLRKELDPTTLFERGRVANIRLSDLVAALAGGSDRVVLKDQRGADYTGVATTLSRRHGIPLVMSAISSLGDALPVADEDGLLKLNEGDVLPPDAAAHDASYLVNRIVTSDRLVWWRSLGDTIVLDTTEKMLKYFQTVQPPVARRSTLVALDGDAHYSIIRAGTCEVSCLAAPDRSVACLEPLGPGDERLTLLGTAEGRAVAKFDQLTDQVAQGEETKVSAEKALETAAASSRAAAERKETAEARLEETTKKIDGFKRRISVLEQHDAAQPASSSNAPDAPPAKRSRRST